MMACVKKYNIFLVGRTGNGKSSTRDSILDRKVTEVLDSSKLVVFTLESTTLPFGIEVNVIDGPGVGDTGADMAGSIESLLQRVEGGLKLCGFVVNAIVVVLKYGVRFTTQEKDAIKRIQSVFGENALEKCGVVLMTYGDNFEMDTEDEDDMTFEKWCREQSGDIQQLFENCSWRFLLFNNRAKENSKQRSQLLEIIDMIESPYDEDDYKAAEPGRQRLILRANAEQFEREADNFLKEVSDNLDKLDSSSTPDVRDVESKVETYLNGLMAKDKGTDVLKPVMNKVELTLIRIRSLKRKALLKIEQEKIEAGVLKRREENPTGAVVKKDKPPFSFYDFFAKRRKLWLGLGLGLGIGLGIFGGLVILKKYVRKRLSEGVPPIPFRSRANG